MSRRTFVPASTALVCELLFLAALPGCRSLGRVEEPAVQWQAVSATDVGSPAATALTLNLTECRQTACERQPRLATQRANLAAAEDGKRALDKLHVPASLDPQIPYRRQQACLGVTAATAALGQAERDAAYGVMRCYITVLFAREQERVAATVVERLAATQEAAQRALDAGARDVTAADVNRSAVYLKLAETRKTQATQGIKRALAALREATGLGPDVHLDVPGDRLPQPDARPNRDEIVATALARRGELQQAQLFAQVVGLEVDAQATGHLQQMQTFAAGSDIHSQQVPQGSNGTNYRPGASAPDMPTLLVGSRKERMKHALSLSARAASTAETTRNLIALEAEDAFLRWEETSTQTKQAREAAEAGEKAAEDLRKDFAAGLKVRVEEVVTARVLASQARSEYNEYLYKQLVALADLERITAGGFCAGLDELVAAPTPEKIPEKK